jgi:hypothetical protein
VATYLTVLFNSKNHNLVNNLIASKTQTILRPRFPAFTKLAAGFCSIQGIPQSTDLLPFVIIDLVVGFDEVGQPCLETKALSCCYLQSSTHGIHLSFASYIKAFSIFVTIGSASVYSF